MTITSTPSEVSYQGDDVSTSFPIPYVFDTAADLKVVRTDSDGNISVLTTGWSVSGGNGSTGTLTLDAPLGAGYRLTIIDDPEAKQDTDYIANDSFPAETHERALDYLTRLVKRLLTKFERTLRVADGDPAGGSGMEIGSVQNRKGKFLYFDDTTGAPTVAAAVGVQPLTQSIIGEQLYPQTAAEIAAGVTPTNYWYPPYNVRRYGAVLDGVTNDAPAIQAAIDVVAAAGGGRVIIPEGEALIEAGLIVDTDGIEILGDGRGAASALLAGDDAIIMLKVAASYCSVRDLKFYGNGHSDVTALSVTPLDESQTTTIVHQNFNVFRDLWIHDCANGIVLRAGPDVGGADSGCWYNRFDTIHIQGTTRGIWMRAGTSAGASAPERNMFTSVRIGQGGNVGLHLESGSTNQFVQCNFEGIVDGTSPLSTPTAIKIANTDANGVSLLYNTFFGVFCEACTRHVDNANFSTNFFGCFFDKNKCVWTAFPAAFVGGYLSTSGPPQALHGYHFQTGNEVAGIPNNVAFFPGGAAVPASLGVMYGAGGAIDLSGTGSPEGAVVAPVGSTYRRNDGSSGTVLYLKESGSGNTGWRPVAGYLEGSASWDPPVLNSGDRAVGTVTVTGAAVGDYVEATFPNLQGVLLYGHVTAANTVTVYLHNLTTGAVDLASGTVTVRVWPAT